MLPRKALFLIELIQNKIMAALTANWCKQQHRISHSQIAKSLECNCYLCFRCVRSHAFVCLAHSINFNDSILLEAESIWRKHFVSVNWQTFHKLIQIQNHTFKCSIQKLYGIHFKAFHCNFGGKLCIHSFDYSVYWMEFEAVFVVFGLNKNQNFYFKYLTQRNNGWLWWFRRLRWLQHWWRH